MPQLGQWYQELLTPEQLASYEEAKNRRNQELELQRMRTQEKVAELVKK